MTPAERTMERTARRLRVNRAAVRVTAALLLVGWCLLLAWHLIGSPGLCVLIGILGGLAALVLHLRTPRPSHGTVAEHLDRTFGLGLLFRTRLETRHGPFSALLDAEAERIAHRLPPDGGVRIDPFGRRPILLLPAVGLVALVPFLLGPGTGEPGRIGTVSHPQRTGGPGMKEAAGPAIPSEATGDATAAGEESDPLSGPERTRDAPDAEQPGVRAVREDLKRILNDLASDDTDVRGAALRRLNDLDRREGTAGTDPANRRLLREIWTKVEELGLATGRTETKRGERGTTNRVPTGTPIPERYRDVVRRYFSE